MTLLIHSFLQQVVTEYLLSDSQGARHQPKQVTEAKSLSLQRGKSENKFACHKKKMIQNLKEYLDREQK